MLLLAFAGASGGCTRRHIDLESRPCRGDADCLEGYGCSPSDSLCLPMARVDCAAPDTVCPSMLGNGASCTGEGLLVPCVDEQIGCHVAGCRTCQSGTWGTCERPCGTGSVYYDDPDGDGRGVPDRFLVLCAPWSTYSATQAGSCDGTSDTDCTRFYRDVDHDGHGVASDYVCACEASGEYRATVGDDPCDDNTYAWTVGACESCRDRDGDGFLSSLSGCSRAVDDEGVPPPAGDCDDDPTHCGAACYPGRLGVEVCDAYDDNCDPADNTGCALSFDTITTGLSVPIGELAFDTNGNLWLGLAGVDASSVVHRIAATDVGSTSPAVVAIASLKGLPITALIVDGAGDIWVGYDEGTCDASTSEPCECGPTRVDGGNPTATVQYCMDYMSTQLNAVAAMLPLANGTIVISTPDDYAVYDSVGNSIVCDYDMNFVGTGGDYWARALALDATGRVWFGTGYDLATCTPVDATCGTSSCIRAEVFSGIGGDDIRDLVFDDAGTVGDVTDDRLWVASATAGFARVFLNDMTVKTWSTANGLPSNDVRALVYDPHMMQLYVGTAAGVARYDVATDTWSVVAASPALASADIRSLLIEPVTRTLWIGTGGGGLVAAPLQW